MILPILLSILTLAFAADYYEILGVGRDATDRELKKAYRSLSRQYHPDKNRGEESAQQKFIEVSEAYEVLSNAEQREIYDRYGKEGLENGGAGGFGGMHHDPMDLFQQFFGGGMFQGQQKGQRRGPNTATVLPVTLRQSYIGEKIEFHISGKTICDECDGSGSATGHRETCPQCNGSGQRIMRQQLAPGMFSQFVTTCDVCGGSGSVIEEPCETCHGEGVVDEDRTYNVFLDAGAPREWDYVIEGEGDQNPSWVPGDLIVHIVQAKDGNMGYRRRGPDLFRDEVISAKQAALGGWSRSLTHLDNETKFEIGRPKGKSVHNDFIEKISGEGMPIPDRDHGSLKGDLYIRYKVVGSYAGASSSDLHAEL